MNFSETTPIYLQIVEYVCEQIVLQKWKTESRIPSVRELGVGSALSIMESVRVPSSSAFTSLGATTPEITQLPFSVTITKVHLFLDSRKMSYSCHIESFLDRS